jgi:hypothetical protein
VLAQTEGDHGSGNAPVPARLMDQATVRQACRIMTAASPPRDFAALSAIQAEDHDRSADDKQPGQYL